MKISKYTHLAILALTSCLLNACSSDENTIASMQGYLTLSANVSGDFEYTDGHIYSVAEGKLPSAADLSLTLSTTDNLYSHTWQYLSDFPADDSYSVGEYIAKVSSLGINGGPRFAGEKKFSITGGERTQAIINCKPSDALIALGVLKPYSAYDVGSIIVHTDGGRYIESSTYGSVFCDPGDIKLYAQLTDDQQRTIRMALPFSTSIEAAHAEGVLLVFVESNVRVNNDFYPIDSLLFDISAPEITAIGFDSSTPVDVNEGITLADDIKMVAKAGRAIASARLTVQSPILNTISAPSEIDLMKLSDSDKAYLESVGFDYSIAHDQKSLVINYGSLLENMASYTSSLSQFTLMVEDEAGVCSEPMTLSVNTKVMELSAENVSSSMIGVNKASMQIAAGGQVLEHQDIQIYAVNSNGTTTECPIYTWRTAGNNIEVEFDVPAGNSDIDVDVYYLGLKRFSTTIKRVAPIYSIEVDPFATNAAVRIVAASDDIAQAVIKYATVTLNDTPVVVSNEYSDQNIMLLTNLQSEKVYTVGVSVAGNTAMTSHFTTEAALQVPEGDFEDWDPLFKYDKLPMGGRYSSTELSIVNRQNYTDINVQWPKKYWASVNDKTFNKQSANHNTWYMQPSSVIIYEPQNGYKAICITSVGWDHNGEQIADYVQKPGESLMYSNVVPNVTHRSAGRLFLGSYSYNFATGQETFNEGYSFTSRPSSLNGFYKYTADNSHPNDKGYVEVEILNVTDGVETIIASGRAEFSPVTDYKAFNVTLSYNYYDLKATKLKIMFASTTKTGSQAFEDANVPLTAHPEKGAMTGSSLWIDNLSFTY